MIKTAAIDLKDPTLWKTLWLWRDGSESMWCMLLEVVTNRV